MKPIQSASFGQVVRLVLSLRFRLFARSLTSQGLLGTLVAVGLALLLSLGLGVGSFLLFSAVEGIHQNPVWMAWLFEERCPYRMDSPSKDRPLPLTLAG